jgi:hypothetical protein
VDVKGVDRDRHRDTKQRRRAQLLDFRVHLSSPLPGVRALLSKTVPRKAKGATRVQEIDSRTLAAPS